MIDRDYYDGVHVGGGGGWLVRFSFRNLLRLKSTLKMLVQHLENEYTPRMIN
jgi:hypothetical protein